MLYKCKCDAKLVCTDKQPTAGNADNFTTWTGSFEHTCVNCVMVAIDHLPLLLRSALLCIKRRSCPAIFLTPSYWGQIRKFAGSRKHRRGHSGRGEVGASSIIFVMRKNQRAANYPYNFALFHPLPAVRRYNVSGGLRELRMSIHTEHSLIP